MFYLRPFLLLCVITVTGCADVAEDPLPEGPSDGVSDKARLQAIDAGPGDDCATSCIWSGYAVSLAAQPASYSCGGVPCACVRRGDIYTSCQPARGQVDNGGFLNGESLSEGGHQIAGLSCGDGCIWSTYAVSLGAQAGTGDCQGHACACVLDDNIWAACGDGAPGNTATPPPVRAPSSRDVPYYYQYDNRLAPWASCQNTSIAMVLAHYGWRGKPDDITAAFGRYRAQSPAGLASVFNTLARRSGVARTATPYANGSLAGIRAELDAGRPVIVHGYFTTSGHVVVVTGYDAHGYYVNDPAGVWSETFKGGYPYSGTSWAGADVYYGRAAFEGAVATSNGVDYLAPWFHAIR